MTKALLQRYTKPALGLAVLIGMALALEPTSLLQAFTESDPLIFVLALFAAIAANLLCAKRWQIVARAFHLPGSYLQLTGFYFQGIAISSVMPGGMVGADVWRSVALQRLAKSMSRGSVGIRCASTVLIDRLTGFWGLAIISLLCGLTLVASAQNFSASSPQHNLIGIGYLGMLGLLVISPLILRAHSLNFARWLFVKRRSRSLRAMHVHMEVLLNDKEIVLRLVALSLLSQAFTILSFGLCLTATGLVIDWFFVGFLCAAIFLLSTLPASIGGFGARELTAIALLVPIGYAAELVMVGSVLFGLTASIQGLAGLMSWVHQPTSRKAGRKIAKTPEQPLVIGHILLSRGFAGSERSTAESCNAQCERHSVFVISREDHRSANGASIDDALDPRVKRFYLPSGLWGRLREQVLVKTILQRERPDIVHSHLRRATRILARIKPNAACIATLHVECNSPHYLQMDGLICNAQWQYSSLASKFTGLLLKANNSVVHEPSIPSEQRKALRSALDLSKEHFFIGCVGRLTHEKGWDQVFDALKMLKHLEHLRVRIFGVGREEKHLEALCKIEPRARLEGFRTDIKPVYQAMDVLICASRFEPLPRVILEAMDAGTPVIASDAEGCIELIHDHGGRLFRREDPASLAQAIEEEVRLGPRRHYPNLSEHYLDQANARIEAFYRDCLHRIPSL